MKKILLLLFLIPTFILASFSYMVLTDFRLAPVKIDAKYFDPYKPWDTPKKPLFELGVSSQQNCPSFGGDSTPFNPPEDINNACVFYKDVDFDGNDEVIEQFSGAGQRRGDAFLVYKKNKDGSLKLLTGMPFTPYKDFIYKSYTSFSIDGYTRFDPIHKIIHFYSSNGWCMNSRTAYQKLDGKWVLISEVDDYPFYGFCGEQHYEVKNNKRKLKFVNFYSEDVRKHLMKLKEFL